VCMWGVEAVVVLVCIFEVGVHVFALFLGSCFSWTLFGVSAKNACPAFEKDFAQCVQHVSSFDGVSGEYYRNTDRLGGGGCRW